MKTKSFHWADINADKIIREKGEKDVYVCASGITPSGTIHIGNFREIISVDLVVRALREKGKNVKFIYSWDEYDVFRKVPLNMPKREELEKYLRQPITLVPDTLERAENYARGNEKDLEKLLPLVGVHPEYIYQADEYRSSKYAEGIKTALDKKEIVRKLLDEHRTNPLADDWMPVSVFCTNCLKDTTKVNNYDGEWSVSYSCEACGHEETVDLRKTEAVKLPWRIDWPMRWKEEDVDFEPAGKDHHTEGGSFDTAREIALQVFGQESPITFQYDFIRIKGGAGKISSSSGEVVSLSDVLEIYQPEIIRYMFAGTRPNAEFAISFDLDVLKIYEDYDKCERIYFTPAETEKAQKKKAKEARIYELSQLGSVPEQLPYQMQIRHLCNLLQINSGDVDKVIEYIGDIKEDQLPRFRQRAVCAWNWVRKYAPEDFRFSLRENSSSLPDFSENETKAISLFKVEVEKLDEHDEKALSERLWRIAEESSLEASELFTLIYTILIDKPKGPRLASFIKTAGKERILKILS